MVKAIIFDCFGVLIGKGFEHTYRSAGGNPEQDHAFIENTLGQANLGLMSDTEFHDTMARKVGISLSNWSRLIKNAELLNTKLLTYIEELHRTYKTAILSNANKGVLERKIGKTWLQKDFDEVIVSAEVGMAKPDPHFYELVIDRLGVLPEECIYIDDRKSFLGVASQLGMHVVWYENFDQLKRSIEELLG